MNDLNTSQGQNKMLSKGICGLFVLIVLLIGALAGVSIAGAVVGGESIKESHVSETAEDSTMTSKQGKVVSVGQALVNYGLWDLPRLDIIELAKFKALEVYVDMTTNPAVGGWSLAFFTPAAGYKMTANKVMLLTSDGSEIEVDGEARVGTATIRGTAYPISDTGPTDDGARRELLDEIDNTPVPESIPPRDSGSNRHRRQLGRRGSLMTMGSFTMVATTNAGGNQRRL